MQEKKGKITKFLNEEVDEMENVKFDDKESAIEEEYLFG